MFLALSLFWLWVKKGPLLINMNSESYALILYLFQEGNRIILLMLKGILIIWSNFMIHSSESLDKMHSLETVFSNCFCNIHHSWSKISNNMWMTIVYTAFANLQVQWRYKLISSPMQPLNQQIFKPMKRSLINNQLISR